MKRHVEKEKGEQLSNERNIVVSETTPSGECFSEEETVVSPPDRTNTLTTILEDPGGEKKPKKSLVGWQVNFVRICVLTRVFRGVKFVSGDLMESRIGRKIVDLIFEATSLNEVHDRMEYLPEIQSRVKFILSQRRSTVVKSIGDVVKSCKYICWC
jgi:hypothetical protein